MICYLRACQNYIDFFISFMNEPITVLTDLLIAVVSLLAYLKLRKLERPSRMIAYFVFYFLMFSISTFTAGIVGHAMINHIDMAWKLPGWISGMLAVLLLSLAGIEHLYASDKQTLKFYLSHFIVIGSAGMIILTFITLDFRIVVLHAVILLLGIVMPLNLIQFLRSGNRGSLFLVGGVLTATIAAIIFSLKISVAVWFNYNDISHVIVALSTFIFFLAAGYSEANPVIGSLQANIKKNHHQ